LNNSPLSEYQFSRNTYKKLKNISYFRKNIQIESKYVYPKERYTQKIDQYVSNRVVANNLIKLIGYSLGRHIKRNTKKYKNKKKLFKNNRDFKIQPDYIIYKKSPPAKIRSKISVQNLIHVSSAMTRNFGNSNYSYTKMIKQLKYKE
jgi:hypothetical protein